MKAQHKFLACLFSLLLLGSCTSDWLEPEQPSKLDPNNAYSTYTGCMGLVTKLCKDLRPEVMGRNTNIKWAYENSDLAVLVNGSPRDLDGMMVPSIGSKPKDLWDNTYKSITAGGHARDPFREPQRFAGTRRTRSAPTASSSWATGTTA